MLYASTQPEGELLSNRYELSHILHVVQKAVELSGVGLLTH